MKRQGLMVLAASAILIFGIKTNSAYGAEQWKQEGSKWYYYDESGSRVTYTWKKGADDLWRYLNASGEMAINSWVDATYYVDANGILLTDKWMKLSDPNGYHNSEEQSWYYFGNSGKVTVDSWKKIDNKWYYFDSDGAMQTGWILDDMYYCGSDGVMRTGWQNLIPPSELDGGSYNAPFVDTDEAKEWYYFGNNGKKLVANLENSDYEVKKLDGAYYCLNSDGVMQTGWKRVGVSEAQSEIQNYKYFSPSGKAQTGWLSVAPPEDLKNYDGDVEWFYFSSSGTPKVGPKQAAATTNDLIKINGRTYLFNEKGNPFYGLQKLKIGNSDDTYAYYYFSDKATSSVVKGKQKIEEANGVISDFYFSDSGRGYTGVRDGYLYYMGKVQKAEDGMKYSVVSMPVGSGYTNYIVNASGKVSKSSTVKDADGTKYKTDSSGVLNKVNDKEPNNFYRAPLAPVL